MPTILNSKDAQSKKEGIGGKAMGLLFLEKHNFRVPRFYILDSEILSGSLNQKHLLEDLLRQWILKNKINNDALWAVRSSSSVEDGAEKSYAGLFTTVTNVNTNSLHEAIEKVLLSYKADQKQKSGVIIQEMIRPDYSGVIFSHDPNNLDNDSSQVNLIPGLGENLVSGKEEAFSVVYTNGKFIYNNEEDTFNGQYFSDKLIELKKTGSQIKNEVIGLLPELVKGTKKLYELKRHPVDIEFAIAGKRIYWLQVRPITTGKEAIIWDNTTAEGNYPGITLPLSISLVTNSFYAAYKGMARFIGMPPDLLLKNEPLLQNMSGEINGGLYYNVSAWQKLTYQLPFGKKASKALPKMWGMEDAPFIPEKHKTSIVTYVKLFLNLVGSFFFFKTHQKKYINNFNAVHSQYENVDMNKKNHEELIVIYHDIESRLGGNWEAPMLNGFFTMILFTTLKNLVKRSHLNTKFPNFINDILFSQGDVISVLIIREFQSLIARIQDNKTISELFSNSTPEEIDRILALEHKELYNAIHQYIKKYGDRADEGELKMETVSYKEDHLLFILYLKTNSQYKINTLRQTLSSDYKKILHDEYRFNLFKRFVFKLLIRQTIKRVSDRENYRFMRTTSFGLMRRIFRAMDHDLLEKKQILNKNDSIYLLLSELTDPGKTKEYADIVIKRKAEYKKYLSAERVNRYIQVGKDFRAEHLADVVNDDYTVSGIGCCSGLVKGVVCIVDDNYVHSEEQSGVILVANYFEPGKLSLFSRASGIISIRGSLLSHTAILCREMGIPSIVGAKGLLSRIKNGDLIEMNGSTGKIKLITKDESV